MRGESAREPPREKIKKEGEGNKQRKPMPLRSQERKSRRREPFAQNVQHLTSV